MLGTMKPRLSPALQQHLVLTPQLRQAIRLLQLSTAELEAEVADAVASNPLLDWSEDTGGGDDAQAAPAAQEDAPREEPFEERWDREADAWRERTGPSGDPDDDAGDAGDRAAAAESLRDHLLWQLHLGHFSQRDATIGLAIIDAIRGGRRRPGRRGARPCSPAARPASHGRAPRRRRGCRRGRRCPGSRGRCGR